MLLALIWRALAAILIIAIIPSAWGQPLQPVPTLVAHAMDHTGTLTTAELQALDQRLARFEQEKGTQIVVLLVPSTAPEDIAAYANRVANTWKIGRQGVGDGMLIVVAKMIANCASKWPKRLKAQCQTWLHARSWTMPSHPVSNKTTMPVDSTRG